MATPRKASALEAEWMPLVEAARVLSESRMKVLSRAVKGELEAQHLSGRTFIKRASVDALMASLDKQ